MIRVMTGRQKSYPRGGDRSGAESDLMAHGMRSCRRYRVIGFRESAPSLRRASARIRRSVIAARPLTRIALVETLHCCMPLPVGEGRIALLHMQQRDFLLSHREREAAER